MHNDKFSFDFRYDRNKFSITDMKTDHILRYTTISRIGQNQFAGEGIVGFDSYVEGNLLFEVVDSIGALTV